MSQRPMTLKRVCEGHSNKIFDPMQPNHVLRQLTSEGHKRVEAFLFEPVFSRQVIGCCGEENVSLGWTVQNNRADIPTYWFKLNLPESQWNACDERVTQFLLNSGCHVVVVEYDYDNRQFHASQYVNGSRGPKVSLDTILSRLTGNRIPGDIREISSINEVLRGKAISTISSYFSNNELYHLSLSRLLIGCHLAPWFRRQPMDIDVCCLVDDQLRMIEFKRKYPAASGVFGIDDLPHGALADWLERLGTSLLHVVLVDPMWDDSLSPTHLLDNQSVTAAEAIWIGTWLNTKSFTGNFFTTQGSQSGMFRGTRRQRQISGQVFRLIDRGLNVNAGNLLTFLRDPDTLPGVPARMLENARDIARRNYKK